MREARDFPPIPTEVIKAYVQKEFVSGEWCAMDHGRKMDECLARVDCWECVYRDIMMHSESEES